MIDNKTHEIELTFEAALNRALHEASKHISWSFARVHLCLGDQRGPVDPNGISVEVWGCDERRPDALFAIHIFPYRTGGPLGLGDGRSPSE